MLQNDADSETGSFTDSGKGPSEEGDQSGHMPPLEPHYTTVKQGTLILQSFLMSLKVMSSSVNIDGVEIGRAHV